METISKGHFTLKRIFEDNWEQFLSNHRSEVGFSAAYNVWKVMNCRNPFQGRGFDELGTRGFPSGPETGRSLINQGRILCSHYLLYPFVELFPCIAAHDHIWFFRYMYISREYAELMRLIEKVFLQYIRIPDQCDRSDRQLCHPWQLIQLVQGWRKHVDQLP
uniref:Uncharacterized protein n=1 Tax=Candidatus Kentrum sp. TC TaxID=2126339 RepID=A0A451ABQ6_9GAMM|nr:MAG: hypothetical protein BECKTC1821E_GA0114239_10965 [Candidatus Kentron sp. TC]VFK63466.1 MAG: hypothetical protein BECKTC1821F_GA0114240_10963 [Candidatus Kentron sp. TC]